MPADKRIAVLPFRNRGAAEDDYLATGITEDLTNVLATTPGLSVTAHPIAPGLGSRDPRDIGRELGVQTVVVGTLERRDGPDGGVIYVEARLINVRDGFQLWAAPFKTTVGNLLVHSQQAARAIAEALTLHAQGPSRQQSLVPQAVELYLRGRDEYRKLWPGSLQQAIEYFDQALALSPDEPVILAASAMARARQWFFLGDQWSDSALEIAKRAVAIAPDNAEAQLALATVRFQSGDLVATIYALDRTLWASPAQAEALLLLGRILLETGPIDQAAHCLQEAVNRDPTLAVGYREMAHACLLVGDRAGADAWLARISTEPDSRALYFAERGRHALWMRDRAMAAQLVAEAEAEAEQLPPLSPLVMLRCVHAALHDRTGSASQFNIEAFGQKGGLRRRLYFRQIEAELAMACGDMDHAVTAIGHAVDLGLVDILWLDLCPLLAPLRPTSHFGTLRTVAAERA
ncbi:MAG: tetratricopeptide repeat protein, partial [Myxococcota bacterium]